MHLLTANKTRHSIWSTTHTMQCGDTWLTLFTCTYWLAIWHSMHVHTSCTYLTLHLCPNTTNWHCRFHHTNLRTPYSSNNQSQQWQWLAYTHCKKATSILVCTAVCLPSVNMTGGHSSLFTTSAVASGSQHAHCSAVTAHWHSCHALTDCQ